MILTVYMHIDMKSDDWIGAEGGRQLWWPHCQNYIYKQQLTDEDEDDDDDLYLQLKLSQGTNHHTWHHNYVTMRKRKNRHYTNDFYECDFGNVDHYDFAVEVESSPILLNFVGILQNLAWT